MYRFSRRSLLASAAAWLAGRRAWGMAVGGKPVEPPAKEATRSRVVLVRNLDAIDGSGKPRPEVIGNMLDRAVTTLCQAQDADASWAGLVRPGDVVGIKSNVWKFLPTPPELEQVLWQRLVRAGVKESDLAIDDRGVLENPVFKRATALVNTRPMRTHYWAGVGSLIKNYIMFVPEPSAYHPDACADLGAIWKLPPVKGKTRLNVLVMLTPQFHSVGPHGFNPRYVWNYGGLLAGFDPVATDSVGLRILQEKRLLFFGESRPLSTPAKHIELADTRHGIGTADLRRIDLVRLGEEKDSLL